VAELISYICKSKFDRSPLKDPNVFYYFMNINIATAIQEGSILV